MQNSLKRLDASEPIDELDPPGASTVNELASALNKLGLTTREMTSILQRLKMPEPCKLN